MVADMTRRMVVVICWGKNPLSVTCKLPEHVCINTNKTNVCEIDLNNLLFEVDKPMYITYSTLKYINPPKL